MIKNQYVALGFYEDLATTEKVLSRLKSGQFHTFATVHRRQDLSLEVKHHFPLSPFILPILGLFSILALAFLQYFSYLSLSWTSLFSLLAGISAVVGVYLFFFFPRILTRSKILNRFKNRVLVNEYLILVPVSQPEVRDVLTTLRSIKGGHSVSFLLRPPLPEENAVEISTVPLTLDQLKEDAFAFVGKLGPASEQIKSHTRLIDHVKKSSENLLFLRTDMADAEFIEQRISPSAEWLLDNMYVLEGSIEDVKIHLPRKYYRSLPKLVEGPLKGLPRIYALAVECVKNTAGQLNRENITLFLENCQKDHPLTIGELWAFPSMLRFRLIEWIEYLALRADNRMREGELAGYWGNRLLSAARHEPARLSSLLEDLNRIELKLSSHFAEELLDHLFDEESVLPLVRTWAEERFQTPITQLIHDEHVAETSEQAVFSNSIRSLLFLSQLSWPDVFEATSPVDAIFKEDHDHIYERMDFTTRNMYRECIERLSKRTKLPETDIAKTTLELAQAGEKEYEKHVGYYLVDAGRSLLEQKIRYRPTFLQTVRGWIIRHNTAFYLGSIFVITLLLEGTSLYYMGKFGDSPLQSVFFALLLLLPLSELATQLVNILLTTLLPTHLRPKMSYQTGIPPENKTLIVIPTMLSRPASIREEVDQLEIRYLANNDANLCFGLFTDFVDAPQETTEEDAPLLAIAMEGIAKLSEKYGENTFFLFHRKRVWSEGENVWMGWERKRGKLDCLNRYLMGETLPENIVYVGNPDALKGTRYVITLDSDTQLPKDQARSMIEILSHPLNRPYLDEEKQKVTRGYTIIQPRVMTDFVHSKASWYSLIFSEPAAIDPYTQAIFNIYQDLFHEGSYYGKGIYDLNTFYTLLTHRFPENHLLSHDLIEGSFARVGYASTACLYDIYPKDYLTSSKRQHRWMRGDWQILDWIFPQVPVAGGEKKRNPLSWINRWKILDNLRRSLLPIILTLLLLSAWLFSSVPWLLTGFAVALALLPCLHFIVKGLFSYSTSFVQASFHELGILILRAVISISTLPFECVNSLDAIIRTFFRRYSGKNLLQWAISESACTGLTTAHQKFVIKLGWFSVFAAGVFAAVLFYNPAALFLALPFCLLWFVSPLTVNFIDKPLIKRAKESLSREELKFLRKTARKTWRYYDELVGSKTHWLPPDNYQTLLNVEVALRTSPTNTGFWLLSLLSAYDCKFITCDIAVDKTLATIQELKKLERHEGHFLNWYNIETLDPLFPRYVSTVDSGNLLACFWTLKQGLLEIIQNPIIPTDPFAGIQDTFAILQEEDPSSIDKDLVPVLFDTHLHKISRFAASVKKGMSLISPLSSESTQNQHYWWKQLENELREWDSILYRYFSWIEVLNTLPDTQLLQIHALALDWKEKALLWRPSLQQLSQGLWPEELNHLIKAAGEQQLPPDIKSWAKQLQEGLEKAQWFAGEQIGLVEKLLKELNTFSQELNLAFLYNPGRKLFSIGYNVDDRKLDSSYYDLLASEARVASFVAIAKEDVPQEHWWTLGRIYGKVSGKKVLLSWGGTMFEYLMPLVFNKYYKDSLLGEACESAVACQIAYGKRRGIPWGISESAFSAIDSHKIYQYKSFGVPGLGLKRGLENDLVISPYSSALALAVNPKLAVENLQLMARKNYTDLVGDYGFYESMDFTRQNKPSGERGIIVHTYMAHHQGMFFTSINNLLNNDILINRFHKDPRVSAITSLLYEKIPFAAPIKVRGVRKEPIHMRLEEFSENPGTGAVDTPKSVTPKVALLSNEHYSLMVTNAGGGYSRFGETEVYRWRADTTRDCWGSFYYIKDKRQGDFWSATYQPTQTAGKDYSANFRADKAEFKRKDAGIETITEIVVSPEDNAEIRLMTLINQGTQVREIELTSYLELVLAPHLTDRSHPSFNKLFIETEALPELAALLAFRRLRSTEDTPIYALHIVSMNVPPLGELQYETDRGRFVGRGNTLKRPAAMEGSLSNTTGTVLDPIFSLRQSVLIEPGKRVRISFVTAITNNKEAALALAEKYKDITASHRAIELAWTYAQLELRYLRIHQEEVQLFQKLASRLLYPHNQLRAIEERLFKNRLGQSGLWSQGISGDWPIIVISVGDAYDIDLVKQMLIAHTFLSLRGLKVDMVILDDEEAGYYQPLRETLQNLVNAYSYRNPPDMPGGVFLRNSVQMPPDELNLILAVANAVFIASRGSLRQQLVSPKARWELPPKIKIDEKAKDTPSEPLPFMELPYFNGLGGFTEDGKEYVIYLGPGTHTPAPWINVIAGPQFGTLVSESGIGCTWFGNSQTYRLTPWSNDPLLNPITDTLYLRDEELGTVWTPTPGPIRELDAYRTSHGQGYSRFEHNSHGIKQELTVFVPVDDQGGLPVRIQKLRLTNRCSAPRRLTATAYSEWILGADKEASQMHVITEWDLESQALFGYNRYNPEFNNYVAFSCSSADVSSFTGDRTEFIGRNGSAAAPEALTRKSLSEHTGASLDPCAALQVSLELHPGQEIEIIFAMGCAPDQTTARKYIAQIKTEGEVNRLLDQTKAWWDHTLETIQIDIPDKATTFLMNRWFAYQNLSCRFWGRTAFYQSSGAYGFRDQLQDVMSILYAHPDMARAYILKAASRQFVEGDVQHWWHPQTGAGIRTKCSDDLLWLPFVTAQYVRVTKDLSILDEQVAFLEGELLTEEQHELFFVPTISSQKASLLEHCRRSIKRGTTAGPHGLPLIGSCDWNDGMNLVGAKGKGESVWLAWFLIHVLNDMAEIDAVADVEYRDEAKRLARTIEEQAWDGEWYRRAYFDDGTPLGSHENTEATIDSLAQSWAIISEHANPERRMKALQSADRRLVKRENNVVLLLTPAFDKTPLDPGYIKGYPPGVRENGGQYTHGSSWLAMAFARAGNGDKAVELLRMLSPTPHTSNPEANALYRVEPYVLAADIYDLEGQVGRGGWTWYTGSAGWVYRIWLEEVLGFKLRGDKLYLRPAIPKEWDGFTIRYRYKTSRYEITVENPHHLETGKQKEIPLVDDGETHVVRITIE